jgi:hypothetical protein
LDDKILRKSNETENRVSHRQKRKKIEAPKKKRKKNSANPYDAMKFYSVIISSFCELEKIVACLWRLVPVELKRDAAD